MKRTIKFRGVSLDTGEFIYGNLAHIHPEFYVGGREVEPESVAQLVGYDSDGNEVYEGDELVNDNGDGFFAELVGAVITDEGFLHADIPPEILKLKEDEQ